jgi:parvulin-like peptidyl-prolyl isomerase
MNRALAIALLAVLSISAPAAFAAERIAAIVNKNVILSSEVDEQVRQASARYGVSPSDSVNMIKLRT